MITHSCGNLFFLQGGKHISFGRLYEEHWEMLCNIGDKITRDKEITHDLVQEVFISFLQKYEGKEIGNVSAFLVQALRFQCFKWLRDTRVANQHLELMNKVRAENTTENDVAASLLIDRVEEVVAGMPERAREVFTLSRYHNLSNAEIASRLNINPLTVERHLTRALNLLRVSLKIVLLFFSGF